MLYIAENIKALRKSRDMTQEDVAEVLSVTAQSVSKWERGDTYPDITLLPSIANLFNVSLDSLLGMEKINDDKARTDAFLEGQRLLRDGDNDGAVEIFTNALKVYPNDEGLMLELALVLAMDDDAEKLSRAESLCERILSGNPSDTVLYTTRAVLCYIYLKSGNKAKAVDAAQILPHTQVCRFTVLEEIDKNPSAEEINALLSRITFREKAEQDILVIDFGLDMLPMVEDGGLLDKISEMRKTIGRNKAYQPKLPMVRVRDNIELSPNWVRVRYFTDYVLDRDFSDHNNAVAEIIKTLSEIANKA